MLTIDYTSTLLDLFKSNKYNTIYNSPITIENNKMEISLPGVGKDNIKLSLIKNKGIILNIKDKKYSISVKDIKDIKNAKYEDGILYIDLITQDKNDIKEIQIK